MDSLRIAVDARSLTKQPTGIANFLIAAVNVWTKLRPNWFFDLYLHKDPHPTVVLYLEKAANVRLIKVNHKIIKLNGFFWYQFFFNKELKKNQPDAVWAVAGILPYKISTLSIVTVHDLVYKRFPKTMSWKTHVEHFLFSARSIQSADILTADSGYTSDEISYFFPSRKSNYILVGCCLNLKRLSLNVPTNKISEIISKYNIHDKSLLFVGTLEPRKNLVFLLRLMIYLEPLGFDLIVVGCSGWKNESMYKIITDNKFPIQSVTFADYISDEDLNVLYKSCSALICCSLMEGYGLPLVEAMYHGLPVVAANNSSIKEVVDGYGVLINGWDFNDWVNEICKVIKHRKFYMEMSLKKKQRISFDRFLNELSSRIVQCHP
jgi:glycosyltransferase involved in cell wall biosynthesis